MVTTIDEAVLALNENHGYIAAIMGDSAIDTHLVAERCMLGSTIDEAVLALNENHGYIAATHNG